jgi:ribosomal protein S18 acetylase RimI-like enzyme
MLEVRAARLPEDADAIAAIDASFTGYAYYRIEKNADGFRLALTPCEPFVKRFTVYDLRSDDHPWDRAEVAVENSRVIGFVGTEFQFWNRRLVLWHLYVDASARRRGVGRVLMARAIARAAEEKAICLWLETSNLNVPGVAWYKKQGFELGGLDTTLYAGTPAAREEALFFVRFLP